MDEALTDAVTWGSEGLLSDRIGWEYIAATEAIPDPLGCADIADSDLLLPGRRYRSGLGRLVAVVICGGGRLLVEIVERGRVLGREY